MRVPSHDGTVPLYTKLATRLLLFTAAILFAGAARPPAPNALEASPERRIFDLTNQDREAQGLPLLAWNDALARAAAGHAGRMAQERSISHQYRGEAELMTRAAQAGAHFSAIAENIATGPGPEAIEREWMHSTPHRANILDPRMNALGVAVVERGGMLYAVEDFAQSNEALSFSQVEQRVRDLLAAQNIDASAPSGPAEQACANGRGIPQGANVRAIVRFETPDLSRLPAQVEQQIRAGDFRRAATGACAPSPSQAEFTTYRVAILFY